MEHPLPWGTRMRLNFHLSICENCERVSNQFAFLRSASRRLVEEGDDSGQQDRK